MSRTNIRREITGKGLEDLIRRPRTKIRVEADGKVRNVRSVATPAMDAEEAPVAEVVEAVVETPVVVEAKKEAELEIPMEVVEEVVEPKKVSRRSRRRKKADSN